jgi:hypothetical protein
MKRQLITFILAISFIIFPWITFGATLEISELFVLSEGVPKSKFYSIDRISFNILCKSSEISRVTFYFSIYDPSGAKVFSQGENATQTYFNAGSYWEMPISAFYTTSGSYKFEGRVVGEGEGEIIEAKKSLFFTVYPTPVPELISPKEVTISTNFPIFSWSPGYKAKYYRIRISEDENPEIDPIWESSEITEVKVMYPLTAEPLCSGKKYYWQVQALDEMKNPAGDMEGKSEVSWFIYRQVIPPVSIISPDNVTIYTLYPNFAWTSVSGAIKYKLAISSSSDMETILFSKLVEETNFIYPMSAPCLKGGKEYFWQVTPLDSSEKIIGGESKIASFIIEEVTQLKLEDVLKKILSATYSEVLAKIEGYILKEIILEPEVNREVLMEMIEKGKAKVISVKVE